MDWARDVAGIGDVVPAHVERGLHRVIRRVAGGVADERARGAIDSVLNGVGGGVARGRRRTGRDIGRDGRRPAAVGSVDGRGPSRGVASRGFEQEGDPAAVPGAQGGPTRRERDAFQHAGGLLVDVELIGLAVCVHGREGRGQVVPGRQGRDRHGNGPRRGAGDQAVEVVLDVAVAGGPERRQLRRGAHQFQVRLAGADRGAETDGHDRHDGQGEHGLDEGRAALAAGPEIGDFSRQLHPDDEARIGDDGRAGA